jgi:hypothetical protein
MGHPGVCKAGDGECYSTIATMLANLHKVVFSDAVSEGDLVCAWALDAQGTKVREQYAFLGHLRHSDPKMVIFVSAIYQAGHVTVDLRETSVGGSDFVILYGGGFVKPFATLAGLVWMKLYVFGGASFSKVSFLSFGGLRQTVLHTI